MTHRSAPGNAGLRRRLVHGFGAQTLTIVVLVGERILMVPLFLHAWGLAAYEDYLVLTAVAGFVRLIDFGMESYNSASLRLSFAAGRIEEFQRHVAVGMGIYLALVGLGLLASTAALPLPLAGILNLSVFTESEGSLIFWIMILTRLSQLPRAVVRPIYTAHGEFSRGENMFTFTSAAQSSVAVALLLFKTPPLTYSIALACSLFFTSWVPLILDQRRRYPGLRYRPALPSSQELRAISRNASMYLVRDWADVLLTQLPVLLIGLLARQPGAILIFNASRTLIGVARQFTIQLAKGGGIEMSRQLAQKDRAGLVRLYLALGRSIGAFTGFTSALILITAGPLIEIWTRGQAPFDPLIIVALIAGVLISGPGQNSIMLLHMSNVPRPLAAAAAVQVTLVIALMALLVPGFGPLGAAIALGFSDCIFAVWSSHAASRRLGVPATRYATVSFGSQIASFAVGVAAGAGLASLMNLYDPLQLAAFYLAALALLSVPALFIGLTATQRRQLFQHLRRLLRLRRAAG